ncbi:MAG: DUF697 domain-containing protein [Merismopedia sp. SIO2A8]|nr:DUF697 domain-containing protein [Symploca sp. SIO2B6]NET49390.1 DUF697 domain-containing protein [Merismopedia sp. SIO2A8]
MARIRPFFLLIGIAILSLVGLWLLATVTDVYTRIANVSPWLANVFLFLFVVVLIGLVGSLGYYTLHILRPSQSQSNDRPTVADQPERAAIATLDAIQQQVDQIQDEVAKTALLERTETIKTLMETGDFQVVIFGVGSTGKTSTLNAILGRKAGAVDASMGTTTESEVYRLQLPKIGRKVLLTDTPGLLDASIWGDERGEQARQLATEADLLLFVIDNDLLQTEYDVLRHLVTLGKRSLLVFNKTDLYTDDEREHVLAHIRQRVQSFLEPDDVVAIAANPVSVPIADSELADSRLFTPTPYILPLLERMATILRWEGETLMAENILLQAQRLGEDTRQTIDHQRQQQSNHIIEKYQWISGGVISIMPLPGLDLLATAAINTQMVIEIGQVYGCDVNRDRAKELAISLSKTLVGLGLVKGAFELWNTTLKLNIATALIAQALQGVTGAYLTRVAGNSFVKYFRQEQTWGDGGITDVVAEQFQLNRRDEFIQAFIQQAMTRIVLPLTQENQSPGNQENISK